MEQLLTSMFSLLSLTLGFISLIVVYRLLTLDEREYEKSKSRYPSFIKAIKGGAKVRADRLPDGIVRAGIVFNYRSNRIERNGKLNNDVVDQVAGC